VCGIAGCYQQADGQKLVDVMSERIAHHGPDAAGTWSYDDDRVSVQFGHRRLSIIGLSAAADQPLSKHGMTLIYNGELSNYRALRTELAARGVRFTTNSDTEVVLESWRTSARSFIASEARCTMEHASPGGGASWCTDGSSRS
jgi:asparagine synthase (glutamine-hydrolysing)